MFAGTGLISIVQFVVSIEARAERSSQVSEFGGIARGTPGSVGAGEASSRAGSAVNRARVIEATDALAILSDISLQRVNTASTGTIG